MSEIDSWYMVEFIGIIYSLEFVCVDPLVVCSGCQLRDKMEDSLIGNIHALLHCLIFYVPPLLSSPPLP